ncbi:phosphatidylcholine:ceramide cholinephosphotransferase 2-like isoform X2 [Cimex lectularius]|uniref:Sphingomyelin synthase-like domain-containing protein n=1 Tax=Cimex lectularius TaxID=79782 RepID=A0A8I6S044_CIMLE|nr:phosphatidylcholine:ceramide cholinephosphotransferase 2-like isoform X2 [Cimex lectularius]
MLHFKKTIWLLKLIKMVLDAKTGVGHNDYGSIGGVGGGEVSTSDGGKMTQSDLYQRQPLLPQEPWPTKNGGTVLGPVTTAETDFFEDDDDRIDGLKRNVINGGGSVTAIDIDLPHPLRDEKFPKEKWKTFIAFIILVSNFIITTASLAVVHEWVPDKNKYSPLPDVILDIIPTFPGALDISEVIIMISTNVTFLVIVMHKHRFIVFRRVFLILAVLYLMRSVTMYVTVLPLSNPSYYCSPKANSTGFLLIAKRVFQLMSGFGLSINGKHTYCGDFIYSGHTVVLVLCYLIINEYSPKKVVILHWASWTASFLGICFVLLARGHYTVDVLIAYYVTTRIFWVYHTLANHKKLKQATVDNCLSRIWWFRIFCYFEGNVGGPVPRQFNWPLPWPRRFLAKHPNRDS